MYEAAPLPCHSDNPAVQARYNEYNTYLRPLQWLDHESRSYQLVLSALFRAFASIGSSAQDDPDWFNQLTTLYALRQQLRALRAIKSSIPIDCWFPEVTTQLAQHYQASQQMLAIIEQRIRETEVFDPIPSPPPSPPPEPREPPLYSKPVMAQGCCCDQLFCRIL